jgi:hypothetical protein
MVSWGMSEKISGKVTIFFGETPNQRSLGPKDLDWPANFLSEILDTFDPLKAAYNVGKTMPFLQTNGEWWLYHL